jgi:hypothetical protein
MDSGLAAIIGSIGGAIVGTLGTLSTTWLSSHLGRKKPDAAEEAAKALLRQMLEDPIFSWRHMVTLANVVGTDQKTVRRLLLEIGARGSTKDGDLWGLVSKHPLNDMENDDDSNEMRQQLLEKWEREEKQSSS